MVKAERWTGKNVNLKQLVASIENYCRANDFEVTVSEGEGYRIQAFKAGAVRTVTGSRRHVNIGVTGSPNDFEVTVTTEEWARNIATSAVVGAITLGAGLVAAGASAAAYKLFEDNLWQHVKSQVSSLVNSASAAAV